VIAVMAGERRRQRRQRRAVGGRDISTHVRQTAEENAQLRARAAAAGLSLPAWLVAAGLADRATSGAHGAHGVAGGGGGGLQLAGMSAAERRAWAAELVGTRRLLRGIATNVNQLAAGYNATGELGDELEATLAAARRVIGRLDEITLRLEARPAGRPETTDVTGSAPITRGNAAPAAGRRGPSPGAPADEVTASSAASAPGAVTRAADERPPRPRRRGSAR
jgi:hypothetical protein